MSDNMLPDRIKKEIENKANDFAFVHSKGTHSFERIREGYIAGYTQCLADNAADMERLVECLKLFVSSQEVRAGYEEYSNKTLEAYQKAHSILTEIEKIK